MQHEAAYRVLNSVFDIHPNPGYNDHVNHRGKALIQPDLRQPGRTLVIGHRGAEALAPENTWASLRAGYEAGADLLELDVQLCRDGKAIVLHDFTLQPKLGDPRWVRDLAWEELQVLDMGGWFGAEFAGERIPLFSEVLVWARNRIALWVDLKHGFQAPEDDRLEMTALALIEAEGMLEQVIISSWDQVALNRIRAHCPDVALAVNLRTRVPDPVGHIAPFDTRWVAVFWPQINREMVVELQNAGHVVALSDLFNQDYAEAVRLGVDAVIARDPRTARIALDSLFSEARCTEGD